MYILKKMIIFMGKCHQEINSAVSDNIVFLSFLLILHLNMFIYYLPGLQPPRALCASGHEEVR